MEELKKDWLLRLDLNNMNDQKRPQWFERKLELCKKRQVEIVKITGKGHMFHHFKERQYETYHYLLHVAFLMKQREDFYIEEIVIPYQYKTENGAVISHEELKNKNIEQENSETLDLIEKRDGERERFTYDRMKAVQYAEKWWNSYHPDFRTFDVDCTNFVSQCIYAGGAPMWGSPNRERGWWYGGNNWSFSWAVAHSLRWYLSGATKGIKGVEVTTAEQLIPGDVICYDFRGDGRFDHTTIVVAKDADGMPLVNAHTDNSRHRYWSYEDSTAWTPNIKYKFFHLTES